MKLLKESGVDKNRLPLNRVVVGEHSWVNTGHAVRALPPPAQQGQSTPGNVPPSISRLCPVMYAA
jgi:hypothetical protein